MNEKKNEKNEKNELSENELSNFVQFKGRKIRRVIFNNEWWFSVVDVCGVLAESTSIDSGAYWRKLKQRLSAENNESVTECHDLEENEDEVQPVTFCHGLKLEAYDGKMRETDCANTEGVFRIIQSIPSPKAEPFKRWLAKVGYERVKEITDPELAAKRSKALYKLKGYSDSWIEKRMRGIAVREELTDEWKNRGARDVSDYEILTAEISKATFDLTPNQYKEFKGLEKENLRDHMNDLELIFNMLGESATTEIHRVEESQGFNKLKSDSKAGGDIAGNARRELEKRTKRSIVNKDNFLLNPENKKLIK